MNPVSPRDNSGLFHAKVLRLRLDTPATLTMPTPVFNFLPTDVTGRMVNETAARYLVALLLEICKRLQPRNDQCKSCSPSLAVLYPGVRFCVALVSQWRCRYWTL
jgi:hypothetical protein